MIKLYELHYLVPSELSEKEIKEVQEKVISLFQNEGGVLVENEEPTKKTLAYPIEKKTEAFLASVSFRLTPDKIKSVEGGIKKEKRIIRYLLLTKKLPPKPPSSVLKTPKKPHTKKVELKELDKKLEEILNEPK